jgi:hypothetical protein
MSIFSGITVNSVIVHAIMTTIPNTQSNLNTKPRALLDYMI